LGVVPDGIENLAWVVVGNVLTLCGLACVGTSLALFVGESLRARAVSRVTGGLLDGEMKSSD
jgi:hypothetical protein